MKRVLADITSGRFVKDFVLDNQAGQPELKASRKAAAAHPIEQIGSELRAMMPWIAKNKLVDKRSEEHTSELQSLMRISYAVFCLKKKKTQTLRLTHYYTNI